MDSLGIGGGLGINDQLVSDNGCAKLVMQGDGNLVLYRTDHEQALWASGTPGRGGSRLVLQSDGNLVLYRSDGVPVWANNRVGRGASVLRLQNDGNLVAYTGSGSAVWATDTARTRADLGIAYSYDFDQLPGGSTDPNQTRFPTGDLLVIFAACWPMVQATNETLVVVTLGASTGITWWKGLQIRNWRDEVVDHLWTQDARSSDRSRQHSMSELSGGRLIIEKAKAFNVHRPMYELRLPDPMRSLDLIAAPGLNQPVPVPPTVILTWDRD